MARPPAPGDARRRPPIPLALECGSDGCFLIGGEATGPAGLQFERLRLEIPDLAFPFEFDGDPSRFRDRRCRLHEATVECPRTTLRRAADRAAGSSRAFSNVEIDLCGGTLQLGARWGGGTHPVSFTVRARPADSSSPHWQRFVLTDCRAFGAPDRPVRRLAAMLADTLLDELAPPPLGSRASLAARSGMVLALRLPALLFSSTFAARGWKLPDVSTTTTELAVSPGGIRWRAEPSGVRRPVEEPSLARRDHPIAEIDDLLADAEYDAAESRLRRQRENRQLDGDLLARLADLRLADPDERALEALDAAVEALPDGDTAPLAVDFRRRFARCRLDGGDRRHVLDAYCRRLEDAGLDRAAAHGRAAASEPPSPDEAGERPEVASGDLAEFRRAHRELLQGRSPEQSGGEQPLRDGTSPNDRGPPGEPSNDARDPDVWEDLRSTDADDDPQARADALERAVEARRTAPGASPVSDREYEDLLAELAELTFVELDESARALPHLEALRERRDDPGDSVLGALETIYREQERYDDLLDVLDERRRRADDDMRATWSVLAARTLWEDLGRPGRAAERVDELLDDRPDHPGALRLGARIALDNEDWERAASHLERLVDREDAGLETREAERRLAELLSERLGRPEEARSRFESILERAPADRRALEGLGVALFQLQDWEAHVDALIRQIGVAAGNPEVVEDRDLDALDLDDLPASERGDVAPTAADAARIAEDHLGSPDLAIRLWQLVRELEPDHPEALERLVELHRRTDSHDRLVDALVARSDGLLDPDDRARSLVEAARVCIEELDEPGRARSLLDRTEELDGASESVRADLDKLRNRLDE